MRRRCAKCGREYDDQDQTAVSRAFEPLEDVGAAFSSHEDASRLCAECGEEARMTGAAALFDR